MNPLVSIVMPVYRHERFVEAAVRSVWGQDYRPIELICVDDGSPDRSFEVLRTLQAASPIPMKVWTRPNRGLCATLNEGVAAAQGVYCGVLASDDELLPTKISQQLSVLEREPDVAGVYGDIVVIDEAGRSTGAIDQRPYVDEYLRYEDVLLWRSKYNLQSCLFRTAVVREVGFDERLAFEDTDFFLRVSARADRVKHVAGAVLKYRVVANSLSRSPRAHEATLLGLFEREIESSLARARLSTAELRLARAETWMLLADAYYNCLEFRDARRCLSFAVRDGNLSVARRALRTGARMLLGKRVVGTARRLKHQLTQALASGRR